MTPKLRILSTSLWALAILGMCALLASWTTARLLGRRPAASQPFTVVYSDKPASLPNIPAPPFSMTDQHNQPFPSDNLKGKVWIADFIFTTCAGPCPLLSQKMAQLTKQLPDPNIRFVSFSVDPETDTPAVLKDYADRFTSDPRWHFLTGPDNAAFTVAKEFKLPALPAQGDNPIFHTTRFILVSPTGQVAGYYEHNDPDALAQLVKDAQALANPASH